MRLFLLRLFLCSAFLASQAQAGAWLFPEGQGQVIVTTTFADARNAYDPKGRLIRTPSYRKFETRAYLEHGVTDWLTVAAEGSYLDFHGAAQPQNLLGLWIAEAKAGLPPTVAAPSGPRYTGAGLGAIGARVKLFDYGPYIFSLEASLRGGASASARKFLDMREPYQADARLQMGRSFDLWGFPGFIDTQIGYRSAGQAGDEIRADFTCGVRPFDNVLLLAQSFSAFTPGAPAAIFVASQKFQLSGVWDFSKSLSLQAGVAAAPTGVNAPAERGVITAVWLRY